MAKKAELLIKLPLLIAHFYEHKDFIIRCIAKLKTIYIILRII